MNFSRDPQVLSENHWAMIGISYNQQVQQKGMLFRGMLKGRRLKGSERLNINVFVGIWHNADDKLLQQLDRAS